MKRENSIFLSIGLAYLIIAFTIIIKQNDFNSKFYLIISFASLEISIGEILKSLLQYGNNILNTYKNFIKKNCFKSEKKYIKNELAKLDNKNYNILITIIDIVVYTAIFGTLLAIPFYKIPENIVIFKSNIFSIIGFALLFISMYINNILKDKQKQLVKDLRTKRKKFISKSKIINKIKKEIDK